MELIFREIEQNDFGVCAEMLAAAYNGEPWLNAWTKEEALLRIRATMSGFNARGYVVEANSEIVAMCLGRIDYYYANWSQFCVDEFNVRPNRQGSGVGKKLVNFVSDAMKKQQVNRIFLITGGRQAAEFYQKNGFTKADDGIMLELEL